MRKILNYIFVLLAFCAVYLFGAVIFGYELPEFLIHKKTPKEMKVYMNEMRLPIKAGELKQIINERDSLKHIIDSLKQNK